MMLWQTLLISLQIAIILHLNYTVSPAPSLQQTSPERLCSGSYDLDKPHAGPAQTSWADGSQGSSALCLWRSQPTGSEPGLLCLTVTLTRLLGKKEAFPYL